ncbi:hypothetical protein ACFLZM_04500, partial [Thermodesulfobacteriota bacterium]
GAHPFFSRGFYLQDSAHLQDYVKAASAAQKGDAADLEDYLNRFCREPETLGDYLERIGVKQLLSLHEY